MANNMILASWALLSLMYITTAIYYEVRYSDKVSNWETATSLGIGFLIFVALNRRAFVMDSFWVNVTEIVIIFLLFFIWFSATMSLHFRVKYESNEGESS